MGIGGKRLRRDTVITVRLIATERIARTMLAKISQKISSLMICLGLGGGLNTECKQHALP
jgi:hypothetical protein